MAESAAQLEKRMHELYAKWQETGDSKVRDEYMEVAKKYVEALKREKQST